MDDGSLIVGAAVVFHSDETDRSVSIETSLSQDEFESETEPSQEELDSAADNAAWGYVQSYVSDENQLEEAVNAILAGVEEGRTEWTKESITVDGVKRTLSVLEFAQDYWVAAGRIAGVRVVIDSYGVPLHGASLDRYTGEIEV